MELKVEKIESRFACPLFVLSVFIPNAVIKPLGKFPVRVFGKFSRTGVQANRLNFYKVCLTSDSVVA